ncbi:MAG: hypothetical protein ACKVOL_10575, partial [Novosphingobium sp.]
MAFQYPEFTFGAGNFNHVDIFRTDEAGRGDEFEVQGHCFLTPPSRKQEGLTGKSGFVSHLLGLGDRVVDAA